MDPLNARFRLHLILRTSYMVQLHVAPASRPVKERRGTGSVEIDKVETGRGFSKFVLRQIPDFMSGLTALLGAKVTSLRMVFLFVCSCWITTPSAEIEVNRHFGKESFEKIVQPFIKKYCQSCHGQEQAKAGMRLDNLSGGYAFSDSLVWNAVHEVLTDEEMPPRDKLQPEEEERKFVLDWIQEQARLAQAYERPSYARRLNRREYANLVTEVLKLEFPQLEQSLPPEKTVKEFDTIASAMQDSPSATEMTMNVIGKLLQRIDFLETTAKTRHVYSLTFPNNFKSMKSNRSAKRSSIQVDPGSGIFYNQNGYVLPPTSEGYRRMASNPVRISALYNDPNPSGFLRIKLQVAAIAGKDVSPPTLKIHKRKIQVNGTITQPQNIEMLYLPASEGLVRGRKGYVLAINLRNLHTLPIDPVSHDPAYMTYKSEFMYRKFSNHSFDQLVDLPVSFMLITNIHVESGFRHEFPLDSVGLDKVPTEDNARLLIRNLSEKFYRRPLSKKEWASILAFYSSERVAGLGVDQAIRSVLEFVLASPVTRTLASNNQPTKRLREYAVASRLAFGLWGGPPDARLLEHAKDGKLSTPEVIDIEVDRMLHDSRSKRFIDAFTRMWLNLDQPKLYLPSEEESDSNKKVYKNLHLYRHHIVDSMNSESGAYFRIMLSENLPMHELFDSNWLPMNDAMAYFYGYPRLIGSHFRKVILKPGDQRGGGVMGQAGVMSMTTWMGANWPTFRGAWALRRLLNNSPPEPPLDVPELDPADHSGKPVRDRLLAHTQVPECATCHELIDPIGHAFQNFDVSGRWRETERETYSLVSNTRGLTRYRQSGGSWPVNSSGRMPRGEMFSDWKSFKKQARTHYVEDLCYGQLQRYLMYFSGREPSIQDKASLKRILEYHRPQQFRTADLLKTFLKHEVFLGKVHGHGDRKGDQHE